MNFRDQILRVLSVLCVVGVLAIAMTLSILNCFKLRSVCRFAWQVKRSIPLCFELFFLFILLLLTTVFSVTELFEVFFSWFEYY